MRRMRLPPTVHVVLQPSRTVGIAIGIASFASLAIALALDLPAWQHVAIATCVLAWAALAFRRHALLRGRSAVNQVRVAGDLVLVAHRVDGALVAGHVRSSTYVGAALTSIVWRPDGAWRSRAILIVPDMLPADDFRRLRVMLRYARSAVEQGAPASHA